jgi:RHS repeat-associated protein
VNQFYTQRPGATGTKHIYAGTTRLVSKLVKQDTPNGNPQGATPYEKDLYFYHPDHLGTSNYITDTQGKLYEHLEYFPFGEGWVEENSNTQRTPYLFTAKELDEETGLYYFGARYYDPRTSVWQSADPILGKYLPTARNSILPGQGGVYNTFNLGLYSYAHQNPVRYTDPDGNAVPLIIAACAASNACVAAAAATVVLVTNPQAREALGKSMVSAGKAIGEGVSAANEKIKNLIFNESNEGKKDEAAPKEGAKELPDVLVGEQDKLSGQRGKRHVSGPLAPEHGGTGNAEQDFETLAGGKGKPAPVGSNYPPGTVVGESGVALRPGKGDVGPRIDIPAKGSKPAETLHYPSAGGTE